MLKLKSPSNTIWALLIFLLILLFNLFFTQNFFSLEIKDGHLFGSLIDILDNAAPVILMAIGMTLVIGVQGIDISVGSQAAISGALAAVLIAQAGAPFWIVVILPLLVTALLGAWNGFLVSVAGVQPIIATLILMVTGRGIAQLITGGQIVTFDSAPFAFIGGGFFLGLPFSITMVVIMFLLIFILTKKTALGMFIETIGINKQAAYYSGVPVKSILFAVYIISGLCAGLAGLIYASDIKAADSNNAGLFKELDAILAVVIGGTAMEGGKISLIGSVLGALAIQSLTTTILTRGVPVEVTLILRAVVVVALCLMQSERLREFILPKKTRKVEG